MNDIVASPQDPRHPHWGEVAVHWPHYGPPLRPCAADVRVMEELVARAGTGPRPQPLRVLLLGVTPEIATMAWPYGTRLVAVDKSRPMLERVWPGDLPPTRAATCADWFEFDCGAERYDVVIGDGTFTLVDFPGRFRTLAAKARQWMVRDGTLISRFFVQAPARETPAAVFADLLANRIASFHSFKLRLAMALQENAQAGVRMGDAFDAWTSARVDPAALTAMTGWTQGTIESIRTWAGKDSRLWFPTAEETLATMSEQFDRQDERRLPYELGERCPIVSFRPRR